jgi:hypothetical protein
METPQYIFIMITSETCGHCVRFMNTQYKDLVNKLKDIKGLNVLHILYGTGKNGNAELTYDYVKSNTNYQNPNISKIISWFPTFMLINMNEWTSPNATLNPKIINGSMTTGLNGERKSEPSKGGVVLSADKISEWVLNELNNDKSGNKDRKITARGHGFVYPSNSQVMFNYNPSSEYGNTY